MSQSTRAQGGDDENDSKASSSSSSDEDMETDDQSGIPHMDRLVQYVTAEMTKNGAKNAEQMEKLILRCWSLLEIPKRGEGITADFIQELIAKVNRKILKFNLEIKTVFGEFTGEQLFILCMTKESPMIMFQNRFKKAEIEMIQNLITAMLNKHHDYTLTLYECVDVVQKVNRHPRLSRRDGEKFVRELMNAFYLAEVPSRREGDDCIVTLGCRSVQEFSSCILEKCPDVLASCKLCVQYLIHGYKCPTCDVVVHSHCGQGYIERTQQCPSGSGCKANWSSLEVLHHRTIYGDCNDSEGERDKAPPKKKSKKATRVASNRKKNNVAESSESDDS